jgi:hypothetical protein
MDSTKVDVITNTEHSNPQRRKAWQHVQKAQAGLLDAMRALDESRDQMSENTYNDCERVLDEAYRTCSQAQGHLLIAERNVNRQRLQEV